MEESASLLQKFMPHGMCYVWRPDILWLNVVSDAAIAIAYFSIPFAMFYFLRRRTDLPFRGVVIMFSLFILSCGLTHLMGIWIVWNGHYGVQGVLKAITALISVATALMLYPVLPRMLALRSPAELEQANTALQSEIVQREATEAQRFQLQQDLAHVGRLSTMGQMAAGLAHELNQPLTAITQNTDTALLTAKRSPELDSEFSELLTDIEEDAHRAGEVIRALRQFVSKEDVSKVPLSLNPLIHQTLRLVEPDAREHSVNIHFGEGDLPEVLADRVQVAQVLINLLRNSIEAISDANSQVREIRLSTNAGPGEVTVIIEDSGPGIAADTDVFKQFETTKGGGMGMGLSISRAIIEAHGGRLLVDLEIKSGARFLFTLPASR